MEDRVLSDGMLLAKARSDIVAFSANESESQGLLSFFVIQRINSMNSCFAVSAVRLLNVKINNTL